MWKSKGASDAGKLRDDGCARHARARFLPEEGAIGKGRVFNLAIGSRTASARIPGRSNDGCSWQQDARPLTIISDLPLDVLPKTAVCNRLSAFVRDTFLGLYSPEQSGL